MTVSYEWIVEEVDEHGDIIDTSAWNTVAAARKYMTGTPEPGCHFELGLTRSTGNDEQGLLTREWAYVDKDGKLPERFSDGDGINALVPQRFHRELAASSEKA